MTYSKERYMKNNLTPPPPTRRDVLASLVHLVIKPLKTDMCAAQTFSRYSTSSFQTTWTQSQCRLSPTAHAVLSYPFKTPLYVSVCVIGGAGEERGIYS